LQTELTEEKSQSLTHRSYRGEHNTFTSRKKKIVTLNVIKKVLYAGTKYFDKPKTEPRPTYNSAPCQKFHSKSSTYITTQKYIWD